MKNDLRRIKRMIWRFLAPHGDELLTFVYQERGVLNFGDENITGERYALEEVIKGRLPEKAVIFDVGANVGNYTDLLLEVMPHARVFLFEPNRKVFTVLEERMCRYKGATLENTGLGSGGDVRGKLYSYAEIAHSELGTAHKEALAMYEVADTIEEMEIELTTVDAYCDAHGIEEMGLLKIDVEGYELEVLKGARAMLAKNAIAFIQFEFNEFNVFSRVFLKDFYAILGNYDLYRIKKGGLVPLGPYRTINEIFKYQNILAVRKDIDIRTC